MRRNLSLLSNDKFRYICAGLLSFAFEITILVFLSHFLNLPAALAVSVSFWAALILSFGLQKLFAFRDFQKTISVISKQIGFYALLVVFNYLFTLLVAVIFPDKYVVISRFVSLSIITCWNYFIYKHIFSHNIAKQKIFTKNNLKRYSRTILYGTLLTLPVIIFGYKYLVSGNQTMIGDFDYYSQIYEAFRISVQEYGQFPAWNPWLSGGIPEFNNPQFGLISLQSLLVLLFGTIYGLKLAFTSYSIIGFWGMYVLSRKVLSASPFRSAVGGYLWVFCSFFVAHNIMHFTFTLFLLTPWVLYLLYKRRSRFAWLWLGLLLGVIALSSLHYAFLMITFITVIFIASSLILNLLTNKSSTKKLKALWEDTYFGLKSLGIFLLVSSYRIFTAYLYVNANSRPVDSLYEQAPSISTMLKAMFLPMDTILDPPKTYWGWWEYTSYMGLGFTIAIIFCVISLLLQLKKRKIHFHIQHLSFIVPLLTVVIISFTLSLGEFANFSPYALLHYLPGFSDTRVSSRWIIFTMLGLLCLVVAWKRNYRLINTLLLISVFELFLSFGPLRAIEAGYFSVKQPTVKDFPISFQQYDNDYKHTQAYEDKYQSYFYTTTQNIGQIYGDDSIINTLNKVFGTKKCGYNKDPQCDFVLSDNAVLDYWSPNRVEMTRTGPGPISINMNRDSGWRVNNSYIYKDVGILDPNVLFLVPEGSNKYVLIYSPKYSPTWVIWRFQQALN